MGKRDSGIKKSQKVNVSESYFQSCYKEVTAFVKRVANGTNIIKEQEIQDSISCDRKRKRSLPRGIIDDEADESSSTQHTNVSASDSNGIGVDDEEQQLCEEQLTNDNSLEALIHPCNKPEDDNAKQDHKITFEGLTIYTEQNYPCAEAAFFLYWPRGIFQLFLNKLLYIKNICI